MKFYENELKKAGFEVEYIESSSKFSDIRNLIPKLEKENFTTIKTTDVCDNWLEKRLKETKLELEILDSPLFINTKEDLKDYFEGKKSYHQTDFYKQQRITRNILMKAENLWAENGRTTPKTGKNIRKIKKRPRFIFRKTMNITRKQNNIPKNILLKITERLRMNSSTRLLLKKLKMAGTVSGKPFSEFGIYEDSIVEKEHFLHHSVLSPLMNVGLLTPENVLEKAISFAKEHDIPVNSLEGFVRQILGWREFVRGVYVYQGTYQRNKNYWKHNKNFRIFLHRQNRNPPD
jgi:deoxyribodipyrimidine photolyase-related protein